MSELIRREDVQREIQASFDGGAFRWQDGQDLMDRINALPTASPWHRVEEGLPTGCETVLVCGKMKYSHEKEYEVFVDAGIYDPVGFYGLTKYDGWMTWNDWHEGQQEFKITHWMPFPEPPKEDA